MSFTYVNITPWLRDLATVTPNCVPKVRKRAFQTACREFFEQTCTWRLVIGPVDVIADQAEYLPADYLAGDDITNANVTRVHAVEFKGMPIRPAISRPIGAEPVATGVLRYYLDTPSQVHIWPGLSTLEEDALTFRVSLAPKMNSNYLPDFAETHLYDALYDGAAGRLFSQPAKAYSDPVRAQYHLGRFRAAIGKYSAQGKTGYSGAQAWCFPRFAK